MNVFIVKCRISVLSEGRLKYPRCLFCVCVFLGQLFNELPRFRESHIHESTFKVFSRQVSHCEVWRLIMTRETEWSFRVITDEGDIDQVRFHQSIHHKSTYSSSSPSSEVGEAATSFDDGAVVVTVPRSMVKGQFFLRTSSAVCRCRRSTSMSCGVWHMYDTATLGSNSAKAAHMNSNGYDKGSTTIRRNFPVPHTRIRSER